MLILTQTCFIQMGAYNLKTLVGSMFYAILEQKINIITKNGVFVDIFLEKEPAFEILVKHMVENKGVVSADDVANIIFILVALYVSFYEGVIFYVVLFIEKEANLHRQKFLDQIANLGRQLSRHN